MVDFFGIMSLISLVAIIFGCIIDNEKIIGVGSVTFFAFMIGLLLAGNPTKDKKPVPKPVPIVKTMPEVPALHPVLLELSCEGENGEVIKKGTKFNLTLPEMAKYKVCSIHKIQIKYEHVD